MNEQFKEAIIEFDKATQKFENEKRTFEYDVKIFMRDKGIPIKIAFFGSTFGLDIDLDAPNGSDIPRKIPINVLYDFCNEFGCDFERTACDGERWIFTFNGLNMTY